MPKIIPFKATLYSEKIRSDLGKVLSPPYDVISPDGFSQLKKLHPNQSVRLALTEDANDPDRYLKMKNMFQAWKNEGTLQAFETNAFYLIEDNFTSDGKSKRRLGFVALLEVSPFEKKEILPHEFTLSGPKKDRLDLLKTMRAELSQIFLCYKDSELTLEKIHESKSKEATLLHGTDSSKVERKVWAITNEREVSALQNLLKRRPALIADGHHRYETAVNFSSESKYVQ
ncbi:MAG: hypothetical protein JWQ35_954, partial [Bacteriovoracaceae bacterium]|nr:hypothetical protein [Bacteriovoracaceae bacterium]